jgi:hypothetical protein
MTGNPTVEDVLRAWMFMHKHACAGTYATYTELAEHMGDPGCQQNTGPILRAVRDMCEHNGWPAPTSFVVSKGTDIPHWEYDDGTRVPRSEIEIERRLYYVWLLDGHSGLYFWQWPPLKSTG